MTTTHTLHEFTVAFECADIERLDMRALRITYAKLMDAAAIAVQCDRLDLDDCVLEHWADVGRRPRRHEDTKAAKGGESEDEQAIGAHAEARPSAGTIRTVRIEWLSDRALCVGGIRRQLEGVSECGDAAIVALRMRVVRAPGFDPFRLDPPAAGPLTPPALRPPPGRGGF